jgi:hypothetical protein
MEMTCYLGFDRKVTLGFECYELREVASAQGETIKVKEKHN